MNIVDALTELVAGTLPGDEAPMFVSICGWADTGKSTLAAELCEALGAHGISADCISTDAFLKDRSVRNALGVSGYNPLSIDAKELAACVDRLAARQPYAYRPYDNRTGAKVSTLKKIAAESVIVVEGIHALHPVIWERSRLRMFIDADEGTLRAMRARANVAKRGMDEVEALKRIDNELDEFRNHVLPGKALATIRVNVTPTFEYSIQP